MLCSDLESRQVKKTMDPNVPALTYLKKIKVVIVIAIATRDIVTPT